MDVETKIRVFHALTRAGGGPTLERFLAENNGDREFMAIVELQARVMRAIDGVKTKTSGAIGLTKQGSRVKKKRRKKLARRAKITS